LSTETSASNAITASSYLLKAAGADSTTWKLRGLAIAAVAFAVGVHSITPRFGRGLQDFLSAVKLFTLFFIVCTGFAALGGHVRGTKPHNFDISTSFEGTSNNGYNIGTALLNAIFSFQGYDNMNAVGQNDVRLQGLADFRFQVLSEVKNPQRTLRIALPTAMGTVTVLYILANIAYVSICSPLSVILGTKIGAVRRCLTSRILGLRSNYCGFSLQQRLWSLCSSQSSPSTGGYFCNRTPPRRRIYYLYVYPQVSVFLI
jgi:amino acid transporter